MNVPPTAEMAPLNEARAGTESASEFTIRPKPLTPVAGWHWLRGKQRTTVRKSAEHVTQPALNLVRSRCMRRCGRAVLIWVLVWYAVLLLIPLVLQHRWRRIGPAHEARKWPALRQLVADQPDRPLLLMLGSSRGCWAFRAGCLNGMPDSDGRPMNVFNFGIPATGPISSLFYLRDMLAEGIRPRFVLIEFLPPLMCEAQRGALTEEGMTGFENLSTRRFLQWLPYLYRPEKRARLWLEARINPWYAFRRQIQLELRCLAARKPFPTYEPIDDWGWHIASPFPLPSADREKRIEQARGGYSPGLGHFRLGKKPTRALRELLDLCRQEHIPAALVLMPESSEFRSWYSDDAKNAIRGELDALRRDYGVALIDAQNWLADDDFEDGHHTLLHGADVFTFRLWMELPRLLADSKAGKSN